MYQETDLGFELKTKNTLIFFGKKGCTLEDLKQHYKDIEFRTVHQTHSDRTVLSSRESENIQADAHYTQEMNVGLVVKTADCIPLLIHVPGQNIILAIHAGWRGVENQITLKALRQIQLNSNEEVFAYIGPHILQKSFEVDADVKDLLLKSACGDVGEWAYARGEKFYVDLQAIVQSQIRVVAKSAYIDSVDINTYINEQFNSHRSDQTKFRNISFIVQKAAPV
jgi:hypothetical protein